MGFLGLWTELLLMGLYNVFIVRSNVGAFILKIGLWAMLECNL